MPGVQDISQNYCCLGAVMIKKPTYSQELKERLDKLTSEIVQLKSILIYQSQPDKSKSDLVWKALMKDSKDISSSWSGCSAVDEIRAQRGG
jgi:hypothetical protein